MSVLVFFIPTVTRCTTRNLKRRGINYCVSYQRSRLSTTQTHHLASTPRTLTLPPHQSRQLYTDAARTSDHTPSSNLPAATPPLTSRTSPREKENEDEGFDLPPPPTDCCMSGCANCVWVLYAEELAGIYKDGGKAAEKVLKAIEDPGLKIFLSLELREKF